MAIAIQNEPNAQGQPSSSAVSLNAVPILPAEFYLEHFLSEGAKAKKHNPIRFLFKYESTPGLISLLAGKPNPRTFPMSSVSLTCADPWDHDKELSLTVDPDLLSQGLQYSVESGIPAFKDWLVGLQEREHGRSMEDEGWKIAVGTGSQDMLSKAFAAIVGPGDVVLIERPTYPGAITALQGLGAIMVDVQTNEEGLRPEHLQSIMENWPSDRPKPKALYTVPYGGNPAGTTIPERRRKEILALARKYNFLIIEDDPYYHLYYGEQERPASYFSLEKQLASATEPVGRVVRLDSLSKILSAGMRIGTATGPASIIEVIDRHTSSANSQTATLTQAMALTIFQNWGYDGFKAHTKFVSAFYREKRNQLENALRKHLTGLADWVPPCAGMFIWLKLHLNTAATSSSAQNDPEHGDSNELIRTKALEKGILLLPGTVCFSSGEVTPYVRMSFSLVDEAQMNEAMRRLREVILEARGGA
ncbi:PLP-dependent transferase [Pterulicium gracile]|uniref:PLP-dependent transferase n=1 Tax=Pterulicium gracile TaxID=1884261 RepID=A0A5C3QR02_9AGAR|nr:PLP-dependent transferase [Pterula gracilis]